MADLSEKELKNAFLKALQDYDAATNTGAGSGGGSNPQTAETEKNTAAQKSNTDRIEKAGDALFGFGAKIIEGGARFKDATGALEKGFSVVGGETGKLGQAMAAGAVGLNKLGQNIDQNVDTWRKLSDTGLSFGNDIMQMKDQASAARMSIAEMSDVLAKNNSNLVGLGMTAGDSAKKLSKISGDFFDSGMGEELRKMGYTTKELNDVMAVSVSAQKIGLATGKITDMEAAESAKRLATEMDAVAKLTGKSKQEQLDDLKRKQEDGQLRAATELAVRQGGEKVRGAFQEMSTASAIGGKDFQKLQEQMFAMGRPSQDMAAKFAMAGGEVQSLMKQAADATKAGRAEDAKRLTEQAAMAYAARQNSTEMLTLAAQGEENAVQMNANARQLTDNLDAVAKANKLDLTKTEDRIKAKELLDKRVEQDQKGQDKDGKEAPTKAITEFAVNVESRGRDLTKALNDQVIQPLAQKTGPELKKFNDQLLGLKGLEGIKLATDKADRQGVINQAPKTIEQEKKDQGITKADKNYADVEKLEKILSGSTTKDAAADALKKIAAKEEKKPDDLIANAMKDKGAGAADLTKKLQDALPEGIKKLQAYEEKTGKQVAPEAVRIANREAGIEPVGLPGLGRSGVDLAGDGIKAFGDLFTEKQPGKVEIVNGAQPPAATPAPTPAAEAPVPRRQAGSLDMAGKMFEDWGKGTMVELHGLEGVMRPQDISKVIESAMGGVRKTMPKIDMAGTETAAPKLDLSNISKSISTSISSVTSGGNATTIKGPDIKEMSKPFEKSFNEFGDNFDDIVAKMAGDINTAIPADMFDDFGDNFDDVVAKMAGDLQDAIPLDIMDQTSAALDFASKRRQELEDIMNDGQTRSGTEWNEIFDEAEQLDSQIEQLTNKQLDAMSKYSDGWSNTGDLMDQVYADINDAIPIDTEFGDLEGAMKRASEQMYEDFEFGDLEGAMKRQAPVDTEFGDLDGAIAKNKEDDDLRAAKAAWDSAVPEKLDMSSVSKASQSKVPNLDAISFGPNGMPVFKQIDAAKQSLNKDATDTSDKKKTDAADANKPKTETKEDKTAAPGKKEATLSDVVASLNQLNTKMGQLITQQADIGNKQVRATKSNSSNLYT